VAKLREKASRTSPSSTDASCAVPQRGPEPPSEDKSSILFTLEARPMGAKAGFDLDDSNGLLEALDGLTRR